ncbi:hypothetical protein R9C00_27950 [Flammeovirgaceae bacterium SG7u.111]|nr:hypothetical protein [Flammeovirgaceae bacterium SG7u.132]WPO35534.1 hypothetical protein R9C00_27950 [Flammeovirgaceae bacterium SG7u.111]
MTKILTIPFLLLIALSATAGGGWPQPKGGGFFKIGQYNIIANKYFTPAGDVVDITTTGYYATSIYGEYGITDKLTAIAYIPFFVRSTLNRLETPEGELVQEGDELNSFGDTNLTLKYGIFNKGPYVGALSLTFGLPLGESAGGSTGLLQSGDGEFNQMLSFDVSRSFGKGNTYATAMVGYNNRTNNFSDEIRYGVEGGLRLNKTWLILRINGIKPLETGNEDFVPNNGIFSNKIEYLAISPEINYNFNDKIGASVSGGFAAYGKRLLASPAFSFGVYMKI